jgi:hypothetical protein
MDLAKKYSAGSGPDSMRSPSSSAIRGWTAALVAVLVLLPLDQSFGYDVWKVPPGQPEQMWSNVNYDPKLTDTFFESDAWGYPDGGQDATSGMTQEGEGPSRLKDTARCYSTSFNVKHGVRFCEARFVNGHVIDLLIHDSTPAFSDSLLVRIRDGKFSCQFWIVDDFGACIWTTTRQKLTLDKKGYEKGDMIKGRIDFECVSEFKPELAEKFGRSASTIKVSGVFKSILK